MITSMDDEYGELRPPEKVDRWEKNKRPASLCTLDQNLAQKLTALEALVQDRLFRSSARAKNYLWAMDADGSIRIAVEELAIRQPRASYAGYPRRRGYSHPSEEKKLGHPTLLNSGSARIAGELAFDENLETGKLQWILNANSGRYCKQKPPTEIQIDKVAQLFRNLGVDVEVDYD